MFIVLELQYVNGTTSVLSNVYNVRETAEQKYHSILAAAAVSDIEIHSAVLLTHEGNLIKKDSYFHSQETQPEE